MKPRTAFKYPGSKANLSSWIIDHFPQHRTFVEVFGGSAAILLNKEPSKVEVYNDADGDLVHFMVTARDHADELIEWIHQTPFSRELHNKYATEYYDGYRPDDNIERAGRFFYLRYTQFAQKYDAISGFAGAKERNNARTQNKSADALKQVQDRLRDIQIENQDFEYLVERYGGENSLLYCDPPYLDEGDDLYSHEGGFEHGRFIDTLEKTNSKWIVSYTRIPERLKDISTHITAKDQRVSMTAGYDDSVNTEHLVMNFMPSEVESFNPNNKSLTDFQ